MKVKNKKILILLISLIIITFLLILLKNPLFKLNYNKLDIDNGIADLTNLYHSKDNVSLLSGEWEFYWNQLLYDKDFNKTKTADAIVSIPSVWNSYRNENLKTTGFGYATYRLHVVNAKIGEKVALRISPLSTAYRFYIDNKLMSHSGVVGKSKKESKAEYYLNVFSYTPTSQEFDIIIQISNYTYARGGLWFAPQIGTFNQIYRFHSMTLYRDLFFIGCFAIMLMHSMVIYILRRKEKSYLIFAIMCIAIITRISVYSSYSIGEVFHLHNPSILVRAEYLSLLWMAFSYMLLTENQFEQTISIKVRKIFCKIVWLFTLFIMLTPIWLFTMGIYFLEAICLSAVIYSNIKLCKSYLLGVQNTLFLISSSSIFFGCAIHDLLMQNNVISGSAVEYMPVGFLFFMISEDLILAINYIKTMQNNEEMLERIEYVTRNEYETNLKYLKSQIKPHFIHNALNSIIAVSRMDTEKSRELLLDFSQYLRSSFDFDNYDQLVSIEHELNFIRSYLSIEKTRFGEVLTIEYQIEDTNIKIPSLILEPLVENAVKHGVCKKIEGGEVIIYVKNMESDICIGVMDTGPGIDLIKVKELLSGETTLRGVGLYNINQRLIKMYNRTLHIENVPTGGTNIYMYIPGGNVVENRID